MLYNEGLLKGGNQKFPLKIKKMSGLEHEDIVVNNSDELLNILDNAVEKNTDSKKKIKQIITELGIEDTLSMFDERTLDILKNYLYWIKAPHMAYDNEVWFDSVIILNSIFHQRLF